MDKLWLSRYAFWVAASALILVIAGAFLAPDSGAYRIGLAAVGVFSAILAGATQWSRLAVLLCGLVALDGLMGELFQSYPKAAGIAHSCLLTAILSLAAALAIMCSQSWSKTAVLLEDSGSPSLRSLAVFAGFILAVQVVMGAAYRRDAISIIPHIIGAMVASAIILYLAMAVFMQYSSHPELKNPTILLTGLVGTQVLLGIGAFLNKVGSPVLAMPPRFFSAVHIVNGSLTMAATVILSMQIHRHIRSVETGLAVNS